MLYKSDVSINIYVLWTNLNSF